MIRNVLIAKEIHNEKRGTSFFALFLLMLVTGVFWGTWFPLTRTFEDFSSDEFIHIGNVIIGNLAAPMRVLVPSTIILMFLSLWFHENKKSTPFYLGVMSFMLIIIVLLITLLVLVPIDNDVKEWTAATVPQNFQEIRSNWKTFHAIRTFASLASFACFSLFALGITNKKSSDRF